MDETATVTHSVTSTDSSYSGASANNVDVRVTDDDDPRVTVSFGQAAYSVDEGANMSVTVTLSGAPERMVEIPITATNQGGATADDYSGVPTNLIVQLSGETSKTITFEATQDDEDDDDESVLLGFGTVLPLRVSAGATTETTVSITDDDDPQVTVSFGNTAYTVAEGNSVISDGHAQRGPGAHGGHSDHGDGPGHDGAHRLLPIGDQRDVQRDGH